MPKNNIRDNFAQKLRDLVSKSGKSQRDICADLNVSASTFNEWMQGKKYPRPENVAKIASYFNYNQLGEQPIHDGFEKSTDDDGLSDKQRQLIAFAITVPDDKADLVLKIIRSIMEAD